MGQANKQIKVVTGTAAAGQDFEPVAFFGPTGTPLSLNTSAKTQIAALTAITTADATDAATAVTLANATKVKVNAIIAALKA